MQRKYQIFISSTFRDLVDERQDTLKSVLDLGHIPSGMEIFPAADIEQFEYIKKIIDECDYYILIIGGRYGSMDEAGVSFTEKEYQYALEQKKTVLAFIHGDIEAIPVGKSDTDPAITERLRHFRMTVSRGRLVKFWTARDDLKSKVIISLAKAMSDTPAIGWVRGDSVASEDLLEQINNLRNQNDQLKVYIGELKSAAEPKIDNLAELESAFTLRYRYTSRAHGGRQDRTDKVQITWADIFAAVGPVLTSPTTSRAIDVQLKRYLIENRNVSASTFPHIFDTDLDTIKIQLKAYGLINTYPAKFTGGGVKEFIKLTDLGQKAILELKAIRQQEE